MYRTSNPALNDSTFTIQDLVQEKMTIQGVAEKGFITLGVMLITGLSVFGLFVTGNLELAMMLSIVGWIAGIHFLLRDDIYRIVRQPNCYTHLCCFTGVISRWLDNNV